MVTRFLAVGFGLVAANYFYQAVGAGNWGAANERSFFQAGALIILYATFAIQGIPDSN